VVKDSQGKIPDMVRESQGILFLRGVGTLRCQLIQAVVVVVVVSD